ncbi:MAG TPA: phosphoribosylanthranilate isomerase [Steroidobacteraceae bacterium]|nr:phosphoribosylanthranilate isomerase [Steroidobacteraceae bacterium]
MALWVKICGLTTRDAVEAAVAAGADAVGFVFAPSKRQVTAALATQLAQGVPRRILRVAVMLHPTQSELDEVWSEFRPDVLQTDVGDLQTLRVPMGLRVMPVVRGGGGVGLKPDLQPKHSRLLFEGPVSGVGSTSDWSAAAQLARTTQLVLAGGLNATNIADAIAAVRPFGVDVSSGVEASPGIKDPARIHEFVQRARAAANGANR